MKRLSLLILIALNCFAVKAQTYKFDFGTGKVQQGYKAVLPGDIYDSTKGYGFEFHPKLRSASFKGKDPLRDDHITSDAPFYFSVKLPEGNYKVKVIVGDPAAPAMTTIKAECRRLMVEQLSAGKGKYAEAVFTVHVKDSLIRSAGKKVKLKPREREYLHWDDKLTLEFNNKAPSICAVEITAVPEVPTIFLAGNSTVVDQSSEPWAAWGQMIPSFFQGDKVAVANYAESGETLKAFKGERRLEKIWSMAKKGDYLFIEFAHNDQKPGGNYLDPFTTYKQTVKEWITEARQRGITPVLVTSMHRRNFDSLGRINNTLGDYPEAIRQTGREEGVAVIDLNAMSKTLYEAWGPERSIKAFVHYPANSFPDQPNEIRDNTHFSTYGAYHLARCVAEGIRSQVPALGTLLRKDLKRFDPAKPMAYEQWQLPASPITASKKPDGN